MTYIYGLFVGNVCEHIGRTRNLSLRQANHRLTTMKGVDHEFRVLKEVDDSEASAEEMEMIRFYQNHGQAKRNHKRLDTSGYKALKISSEQHRLLRILAVDRRERLPETAAFVIAAGLSAMGEESPALIPAKKSNRKTK